MLMAHNVEQETRDTLYVTFLIDHVYRRKQARESTASAMRLFFSHVSASCVPSAKGKRGNDEKGVMWLSDLHLYDLITPLPPFVFLFFSPAFFSLLTFFPGPIHNRKWLYSMADAGGFVFDTFSRTIGSSLLLQNLSLIFSTWCESRGTSVIY